MSVASRRQELLSLLQDHSTDDVAELVHRQGMLQLLARAGDPFARDHMVPGHLTASAFVVTPDFGQLLLIFHGKLRRWLQPGGHFEPADEDCVAAARREVAEETGLDDVQLVRALFDLDVHAIPAIKADPAHLHFDVRSLFVAAQRGGVAASDALGLRWVPLDEVNALESDASVMRAVRRLQLMRAGRGSEKGVAILVSAFQSPRA